MRITKIRLKNYVGIYNGVGIKDLKLDFQDIKVVLISGSNGSGKSSIMETLHPLPDTSKQIRKGCKGYKLIELEHEGIQYIIEHHYTPKAGDKGHNIKSYIKMVDPSGNVTEYNDNGNVGAGRELVDSLLGVNPEYLSMVRLGSTFSSFIELSSTDRSKFISKFLSEIDIYLKYHKKLTNDMRVLKTLVKNISNKLEAIGDYEALESRLIKCDNDMIMVNKKIDDIGNDLYHSSEVLKNLKSENIISKDIEELDTKKIERTIEKINLHFKIKLISYGKNIIDIIESCYNTNLSDIDTSDKSKKDLTKIISEYDDMIDDIRSELDLINIDECNEIVLLYRSKELEILDLEAKYDFNLPNVAPEYTKSELFQAAAILDEYLLMIDNIHGSYSEKEFNELKKRNDRSYYLSKYTHINNTLIDAEEKFRILEAELQATKKHFKILDENYSKRPTTCKINTCPLLGGDINVYEESIASMEAEREKLDDSINDLTLARKFNANMVDIIDTLANIFKSANRNYELFNKIPFIKFDQEYIADCFILSKELYDINDLEKHSDIVESYELYKKGKDTLLGLSYSYNESVKSLENIDSLKNKLVRTESSRDIYENTLRNTLTKLENMNEMTSILKDVRSSSSDYVDYVEYLTNSEKLLELSHKIKDTNIKVSNLSVKLEEYKRGRDKLTDYRNDISYKHMMHGKLVKERDFLKSKLVNVDMVKDAMSSNKGIPHVYIDLYLQQVRILANGLLEEAFHGMMKLDDFIINESEFRIPFTRTESNDDIKSGSAGERAIASLVLSFAFISHLSADFNIMFLDEIDGPLDKKNRKSFANAVETQMEIMGMEQCFIISHNDSFMTKNVGYILLKDHGMDNVDESNVIFEY